MGNHRNMIETIDLGQAGEREIEFAVIHYPSVPASGMFGPWEDSDPGCGSELEITGATLDGKDVLWLFNAAAIEQIAEYICEEIDDEEPDFNEQSYEDRWEA